MRSIYLVKLYILIDRIQNSVSEQKRPLGDRRVDMNWSDDIPHFRAHDRTQKCLACIHELRLISDSWFIH